MKNITNGATRPGNPKNVSAGKVRKISGPAVPLSSGKAAGLNVVNR